jgi:hypothetical protein
MVRQPTIPTPEWLLSSAVFSKVALRDQIKVASMRTAKRLERFQLRDILPRIFFGDGAKAAVRLSFWLRVYPT